tara:strand:+ start:890 stop:1033 length:144 start_codon:yes stop_codon:yes gene_type:complete
MTLRDQQLDLIKKLSEGLEVKCKEIKLTADFIQELIRTLPNEESQVL